MWNKHSVVVAIVVIIAVVIMLRNDMAIQTRIVLYKRQ